MTLIDLGLFVFVAIFIATFYSIGFWTLLKSLIAFATALFLASILLNPILSTFTYFGWTENLYTPLVAFPFLIVAVWGIILSFLTVAFPKSHAHIPHFIQGIVSGVFAFLVYLLIILLLSRFVPIVSVLQDLDNSFLYRQVKKIHIITNFKDRYLGSVLKPVIISQKDTRAMDLNFEIGKTSVIKESADRLFELVNSDRSAKGLVPFSRDPHLDDLAQSYGLEIISMRYFSHYSKDGSSPEERAHKANVAFDYLGENLALAPNVDTAYQSFMSSAEHKENIELPLFKRTGISCIDLGNGEQLFVQEFSN